MMDIALGYYGMITVISNNIYIMRIIIISTKSQICLIQKHTITKTENK